MPCSELNMERGYWKETEIVLPFDNSSGSSKCGCRLSSSNKLSKGNNDRAHFRV